ncbi:Type I Iterative PKS [Emmonsiellopsis sp. PD_33]|nr:Type I Iterative PKS [Emmonsiellopsis sp. PD_33]
MTFNPPSTAQPGEPIAIIGSGCRFPGGADSPSKLWDLLSSPRDVLKEVPESRFNPDGYYHPDGDYHGHSNVRHSHMLDEDHRQFDADFFNISSNEAATIDPQQRLLLETVYESLEAAGLTIQKMKGSDTAVYVGAMCCEYSDLLIRDLNSIPVYFATGTARSIMANRISYFFDWHGESMSIDTACSSSLVALHQSVQALRAGTSRVAITAGANLLLGPEPYIAQSKFHMLSPTGRCHMWDSRADGYGRGDGFASLVLKTLSAAIEDGDHIECIIRETGVNQDGRTKGISMPSADAQIALIEETYRRAGLDLNDPTQRCQFFEAHGTGTPAGDPIEAEAVHRALGIRMDDDEKMFVGSIKSLIGHTEGTAGLAGIMKVSLALQNSSILPNRLFDQISPAIKPFYGHLEVPTDVTLWPELPLGVPRRASVNSFGFGGTNVHAIVESYEPKNLALQMNNGAGTPVFAPFVFSAMTQSSLKNTLSNFASYLKKNPSTDLHDLAWTLHSRRSVFPVRAAFHGLTVDGLRQAIKAAIDASSSAGDGEVGSRASAAGGQILGVFTGQGAQWPGMLKELILNSEYVKKRICYLESVLQSLPESDRPSWSLNDELLADGSSSRLGEATLSQPLCTVVQIILVDLLCSANVGFSAVVGHSSGEIGAAYAAGYLSARDAMIIAYYRGLHAHLAQGNNAERGAMMAVGISLEEGQEFCRLPQFEGQISVAACNSPSSITLSGNAEAIENARQVFEKDGKFARLLRVDKAYHSHHMIPCSRPYIDSLKAANLDVAKPTGSCVWYSSVHGRRLNTGDEIDASYWAKNMTQSVLFSQAVQSAVSEPRSQFVGALEVGPHGALKGPVEETLKDIAITMPPYSSCLVRNNNAIESFSGALGHIWKFSASPVVDLENFERTISGAVAKKPAVLKNLPKYSWDHDGVLWFESRRSKALRKRSNAGHPLLGTRSVDCTENDIVWLNNLRLSELPWLRGHQLQGQTVFPAAGYIALAVEAAAQIAGAQPIRLIEVKNLAIARPITFEDERHGVDTMFCLHVEHGLGQPGERIVADFRVNCAPTRDAETVVLAGSGQIEIALGQPVEEQSFLPPRNESPPLMADVEKVNFYSALKDLGYDYSGSFQGLSSIKRKLGRGAGLVSRPIDNLHWSEENLLVHPAMLDTAFQSIFLAHSWPGDGRLWSLHVPVSIDSVRVDAAALASNKEAYLSFDSVLTADGAGSRRAQAHTGIHGDVDLFTEDGRRGLIQVEGINLVPFAPALASQDRQMFFSNVWNVASPNGELAVGHNWAPQEEIDFGWVLERVSYFYLRKLVNEVTNADLEKAEWHHHKLLDYARHIMARVADGTQPYGKKEWNNDTAADLDAVMAQYPDSIEIKIMRSVGENLVAAVRGETVILQHMLKDGMLHQYYVESLGVRPFSNFIAEVAAQAAHRYPRMNILEIGAGTGGATRRVIRKLGDAFSSYTFTDISTGFFEKAKDIFSDYSDRMIFKALDAEKDITDQGYEEHSYDLIVASLVLHATKDLVYTMTNVQRLLKPGGTLVMLEVTANDTLRMSFTMGGLSGWWLGADSGRPWSPCVSTAEWHDILLQSGFSGVDTVTPTMMTLPRPFSVIVSRAVDTRIKLLEQPLLPSPESRIQDLLIIGGTTPETGTLSKEIKFLLEQHTGSITTVESLDFVQSAEDVPAMGTIICLSDLDKPVFKDLTTSAFQGLKAIFARSRNILWLTRGCRGDNPYANMTVGFGRVVAGEMSNVRLQFIDFDKATQPDPRMLVESVLRLHITDHLQKEGRFDDIIWSTEPEMAFDNGKLLVPRVIAKKDLNDRYNSERRLISKSTSGRESRIKVGGSDGSYTLQDDILPTWVRDGAESDMVTIQVDYSFGSAIPISPKIALYPLVGRDIKRNIPLLALSESSGSSVVVPRDLVIPYALPAGMAAASHLLLAAYDLLAQFVLTYTEEGGTLLLLEPEPLLADVIERRSAVMGVTIACLTASSGAQKTNWKFIHPLASSRSIKMSLPPNVSTFLDLSQTAVTRKLASRITCFFPSNVKILDIPSFQTYSGSDKDSCDSSRFNLLIEAFGAVDSLSSQYPTVSPVVLSPLDLNKASTMWFSITDWMTSQKLPVSISPADSVTLIRSDRTYVLIGLARGLGPSLCEWMVGQGARYIVLTSRNPKTDQEWVSSMGEKGVVIKVYANDVSNREDLTKMITEIRETLPQIGGVANGAMVIDDTPVVEMAYEQMDKVLRPKVDGSRFLDELFYDEPLDFFILFSSLSCTFGRSGQANYIAANMYMTSLAANRRRRGLPASVIDVGAVVGIGYITREVTQKVIHQLPDAGFHFMSERDIHLSFAEAIICGYPDSGQYEELITGLRVVWGNEEARPGWYSSPRFSHTVRNTVNDPSADKNKAGAIVSVRDLLKAATSASQVVQIIQDSVIDKLKIVLQLRPEVLKNPNSLMEQGADDLGMDSLVAVEIRSWFLRELEVDMPVLKILGGATLAEIVDFAVKNLPSEFIAVQEIDEDSTSNSDSNTGPNTLFTEESLPASTSQSSPPSEVDSKALFHDREMTDNQSVPRTPSLDIKPETAKEELSRGDIDWLRETTVDESLKLIKATTSRTQAGDHISVALTGSTGFLGKSILQQLVAMDQVKKVHCLAIRSLDKIADINSDKLVSYCGDLSEANLGLSPEDACQIFGESDIIIHNGADVSLLKNYRKLSSANFNSTKELVRLALECGTAKQFHYISSTSVGQVSGKKDFYEESLSAFTPPADGVMGYVATKWASERYLENINQSTNLPVWIHRPSTIIGEDAPKVDIMHNLLHYSKELNAVPNFGDVNGWFHFVTVEEVSRAITDQFFTSVTDICPPPVTYVHHNGAEEVEMHEFKGYMEKKYNTPYQVLEMNEWIQQSESVGLLPQISVFMTAVDSMHGNGRDLQRIRKGKREEKQTDL